MVTLSLPLGSPIPPACDEFSQDDGHQTKWVMAIVIQLFDVFMPQPKMLFYLSAVFSKAFKKT